MMRIFLVFHYQEYKKDGFQKIKVNWNQEEVFQKMNLMLNKNKKRKKLNQEVVVGVLNIIKSISNIRNIDT